MNATPTPVDLSPLAQLQDEMGKKLATAKTVLGREYNFDEQQSLAKCDWMDAQSHAEAAVYKTLEMGKRLLVMKEIEGHGKMADVCHFVGIDIRRADEAMGLFREIGNAPALPKLLEAGQSKLLEFMRLPKDIKGDVLETGMLGGEPLKLKSVRELRELAKRLKVQVDELTADLEQGEAQVAELEAELSGLKNQRKKVRKSDEAHRDSVIDLDRTFGEIDYAVTVLDVEAFSDDNLVHLKKFIDGARAKLTLWEAHIDERCGFLSRIGQPVIDVEYHTAKAHNDEALKNFAPLHRERKKAAAAAEERSGEA